MSVFVETLNHTRVGFSPKVETLLATEREKYRQKAQTWLHSVWCQCAVRDCSKLDCSNISLDILDLVGQFVVLSDMGREIELIMAGGLAENLVGWSLLFAHKLKLKKLSYQLFCQLEAEVEMSFSLETLEKRILGVKLNNSVLSTDGRWPSLIDVLTSMRITHLNHQGLISSKQVEQLKLQINEKFFCNHVS